MRSSSVHRVESPLCLHDRKKRRDSSIELLIARPERMEGLSKVGYADIFPMLANLGFNDNFSCKRALHTPQVMYGEEKTRAM